MQHPAQRSRRDVGSSVVIGLVAALLVTLLAWPMPFTPSATAIGGGGGDFASIAWGLWRVAASLPGLPPLHVTDIAFPDGATLLVADLPEAIVAAPVTLLLGPVVAANLVQVAHVGLATGFAHAWLRPEGSGRVAGAVAFGLCTVLMTGIHNGNADTTATWLLPAIALLARDPWRGVWPAVGLGLLVGATPWFNPYIGVMGGLVAVGLAPTPRGRGWLTAGASAGLALALGGAFVALARWSLTRSDAMVFKSVARPLGAGAAWLSGYVWPTLTTEPDPWTRHGWYLGWSVLILAGVALLRRPTGTARWLVLGLAGLILSLGPALRITADALTVGGHPVWLPGAWLARLPGLDQLMITYRYGALVALAAAALAARGASLLPRPAGWAAPLLVALDLLLVGSGASLVRGGTAPASPSCALLAELPDGAVVDLPSSSDDLHLLAQTCHGRPVAQGVKRPFTKAVRAAIDLPPERALKRLRRLGFRYLVLHDALDGAPQQLDARERLGEQAETLGTVVAQGSGVRVVDLGT